MPRKSRSHNTIPSEGIPLPKKQHILGDGYVRVHQLVWAKAMEIAEANAHRIEVHSSESVTIHNNVNWRKSA